MAKPHIFKDCLTLILLEGHVITALGSSSLCIIGQKLCHYTIITLTEFKLNTDSYVYDT
jgi:hypothetical protein